MTGFARCRSSMLAMLSLRLALPLVALAGSTASFVALAAEKAPARAPAAASAAAPRSPILTPAQLQECVNQKERLHAQTDDALKDKATIEADKAEILRLGTSLAEERETVDRTSDTAVDAYNAKLGKRDKLVETYEARVDAYNVKAETVKTTKDRYEKSCENRRYDERDLNDLKRKK